MSFTPWIIAAEFGLSVGLGELQKWLADPPPDDRAAVFTQYPSTVEGTPIPMVYGRTRVRQPYVAWYGIPRKRELEHLEGLGNDTPVGEGSLGDVLHYGMSMLFVVGVPCGPVATFTGARLLAIYDGDTKYELNLGHADSAQLFGGKGVLGAPPVVVTPFHGTVQFFAGTSNQLISDNAANNPLLPADQQTDITQIARFMRWAGLVPELTPHGLIVDPAEIPGYRNQMLVAFSGDSTVPIAGGPDDDFGSPTLDAFYWGPSATVPHISIECEHTWLAETEPQ